MVGAQEFRMRRGTGALGTPRLGSCYELWELPERGTTNVRPHKWHVAARLGPHARGDATNYPQKVEENPRAIRRPSRREALRFLRAPFKLGVPASMNPDAPPRLLAHEVPIAVHRAGFTQWRKGHSFPCGGDFFARI